MDAGIHDLACSHTRMSAERLSKLNADLRSQNTSLSLNREVPPAGARAASSSARFFGSLWALLWQQPSRQRVHGGHECLHAWQPLLPCALRSRSRACKHAPYAMRHPHTHASMRVSPIWLAPCYHSAASPPLAPCHRARAATRPSC